MKIIVKNIWEKTTEEITWEEAQKRITPVGSFEDRDEFTLVEITEDTMVFESRHKQCYF
ncbi:MAG: hypothetical protein IKN65_06295 [Clostridia bacterium]|nr:hypothetical protein [Clostridia bacterium]